MHVVRHQAVSDDLHIGGPACASQQAAIQRVITIVEESCLATIATLGDVVWHSRNDNSRFTGHAHDRFTTSPSGQEQIKNNSCSPFKYAAPDGSAKTMSAVLGEIVWLMSQSPIHKSFSRGQLPIWKVGADPRRQSKSVTVPDLPVMTPVMLKQFRMFYDKDKPIGVVFWGTVSDDVAARLAEGTSKLRPQDWKSGDNLWVVEVIAPFGGPEEMVKDLKAAVFPDREIRMLVVKDGKRDVRVV
jgi:cytolysin-activating lysine-acyltransferase